MYTLCCDGRVGHPDIGFAFVGEFAVIEGAKYAKSHEYVKIDGDVATVGISDFAQVSQDIFVKKGAMLA